MSKWWYTWITGGEVYDKIKGIYVPSLTKYSPQTGVTDTNGTPLVIEKITSELTKCITTPVLSENSFFSNNYLGANNQYIASLINYITANFDYSLKMEEKGIEYKYKYRIDAEVNVKEKDTNNSLYNYLGNYDYYLEKKEKNIISGRIIQI